MLKIELYLYVCMYVLYVNCDLFKKKYHGDGPDFNKIGVNNALINGY